MLDVVQVLAAELQMKILREPAAALCRQLWDLKYRRCGDALVLFVVEGFDIDALVRLSQLPALARCLGRWRSARRWRTGDRAY